MDDGGRRAESGVHLDGGIDQDATVLAAMRAVDSQHRVDRHAVLERDTHAPRRPPIVPQHRSIDP